MWKSRAAIVAVTAIALIICYSGVLRGMAAQWANDEDMGHGFLVPVVIAWILWRERRRWECLPVAQTAWGFVALALAAGLQIVGAVGGGLFAGSVALLISIIGAILCLGGFVWLRAWAFPLLLALFMLPKLAVVYNQVTLPLQLLATRIAGVLLTVAGYTVVRSGNILDVSGHQVSVIEACSGIRYLLPLGFIALVLAYIIDSKAWMRAVLLAAAVPIAILANAVRVAVSGASPTLSDGTPHMLVGGVIFLLCLGALAVVRLLFNFVYERYHA